MIIQTKFIPAEFDAVTIWPFIFVRPGKQPDTGLIEHELVHYREQIRMLILPWLLAYFLSKRFRLDAEVRAYKRQMEVGGISRESAASMLLRYRLGITYSGAMDALK